MISKTYEKADFKIIEFVLEDVLTASSVVHTTQSETTTPATTVPGTTSGGVQEGTGGGLMFDFNDFFK